MRISDWSSDVCSSDLLPNVPVFAFTATATARVRSDIVAQLHLRDVAIHIASFNRPNLYYAVRPKTQQTYAQLLSMARDGGSGIVYCLSRKRVDEIAAKLGRSEEHTSELQSLMRISYAVF